MSMLYELVFPHHVWDSSPVEAIQYFGAQVSLISNGGTMMWPGLGFSETQPVWAYITFLLYSLVATCGVVSFLSVPLASPPSHTWEVLGAQNDGCPQNPPSSSQFGLDLSFTLFSHLMGDGAQGWSWSGGQLLLSSLNRVHPGFGRGFSQKVWEESNDFFKLYWM